MLTDLLPSSMKTTTPTAAAATTAASAISSATGNSVMVVRRIATVALFVSLSSFVIYRAGESVGLRIPTSFNSRASFFVPDDDNANVNAVAAFADSEEYRLENVLKNAAMEDKTVILTTLNEAWAAPGAVFDLFLESFRIGDHTRRLLNHLVIVALDEKAFSRCLVLHTHCYPLVTQGVDFSKEAYFMFPDYLKMMWRRIDFLRVVLEMGYNFVFTDADVMWFRDPFPRFYEDADFQIACDHFSGEPDDVANRPNGGFNHVMSNNRSIEFYKYWYSSRERYPGLHDQDVLNNIKNDSFIRYIDLKMRFLDTTYFGGFCEPSKNLSEVCTMHANCCFGLDSKLHDLKLLLQDWKDFLSLPPAEKVSPELSWQVPQNCSLNTLRHYNPPPVNITVEESVEET